MSEKLAIEHWEWIESLIKALTIKYTEKDYCRFRKFFIDGFVHGYKHGKESMNDDRRY